MSSKDTLKDEAEQVFDRAKSRARKTVSRARDAAERAREQVDERAEQLRSGYARVEENVRHAADDFAAFVEDSPARAVLLAAAIGFLLGLLSRGFRRD